MTGNGQRTDRQRNQLQRLLYHCTNGTWVEWVNYKGHSIAIPIKCQVEWANFVRFYQCFRILHVCHMFAL